MKKIFIILLFLLSIVHAYSQETKVKGLVIDADNQEPIPFANIAFKGTSIGTVSSMEGEFFLSARENVDTLIISYLGYKAQNIPLKKGKYQTLKIRLVPDNISLAEVVILPGENPAFKILRGVNDNKYKNNPNKVEKYKCQIYNKMQVDINNLSEKFQNKKWFKKFNFVFDYMDTSVVNGKNYLPILISETSSDYYYRKFPNSSTENITAYRVSGVNNETVSQYTGQLSQRVNVYDNYVDIVDRSFVSPISNIGKAYYKYRLLDSAFVDNKWCYQISFSPKYKHEPTFNGVMWIADTSFAVKQIELNLSEEANLNLIKNFYLNEIFDVVDGQQWMIIYDKLVMDFNIMDNTMGIFARKTTHYSDFIIDQNIPDSIFSVLNSIKTVVKKNSGQLSDKEWNSIRKEELNETEKGIYVMVDSIKNVPLFKTYVDVIKAIFNGYYKIGKVEIGDYTSLYSYNEIEGSRFKLMLRTSPKFSKKIFFDSYLAYGIKDNQFKYSLGSRYYFRQDLTRSIGFEYAKDLEQLGSSLFSLQSDNMLSALFSRTGAANMLTNFEKMSVFSKIEWISGFSNTFMVRHRILSPNSIQKLDFRPRIDFDSPNEINITEFTLNTRIAFNENTIMGREEKVFLSSRFPVLNFDYTYAPKQTNLMSDFEYHRLQLGFFHTIKINPLGRLRYYIEGGKIFGNLPYPLLEMHNGNETFWYDTYSFNLMNYYEFISDQWVSFWAEYHFEGFFLNKIPLLNKLKWREVATIKGVMGSISDDNKNFSYIPEQTQEVNKPYLEASVGVENILKVFRIDALWRLSYLDKPNIAKFGIRAKVQFAF